MAKCAAFRKENANQDTVPLYLAEVAEMWPGPRTITGGGESAARKQELGREESGGSDLQAFAEMWSSPSAHLYEMADMDRMLARRAEILAQGINGNGFGLVLSNQAQLWAETWPGPAARDYKGANSAEHMEASSGSLHLDQLANFVEHVFLPPFSPDLPISSAGETCSTASPNISPHSPRRKLNPIFVEALMRWPIGLSGFERPEMALIRWWLHMPSLLSALASALPPAAQLDLFDL